VFYPSRVGHLLARSPSVDRDRVGTFHDGGCPRPKFARTGIYFRGHAPATGADTQEVVLEVCQDEGLQRVIWFKITERG
jgi:hypothetical protein